MCSKDVKQTIKNTLATHKGELWVVVVFDPSYAKESLSECDNRLAFSKEEAIEIANHFIYSIFRRERLKEVDNATVEGLPGEKVIGIITSALKNNHMVTVNGITFHIVKTSFY